MALPSLNFKEGSKYSFEVYPAALIPSDFSNVEVLAIYTERIARKFIGTHESHANFYPYLPAGTPNDAAAYSYIHILMPTGVETVVGVAWIKPDSVRTTDSDTFTVTVRTDLPDAANRIRNALVSNNFSDIDIQSKKTAL